MHSAFTHRQLGHPLMSPTTLVSAKQEHVEKQQQRTRAGVPTFGQRSNWTICQKTKTVLNPERKIGSVLGGLAHLTVPFPNTNSVSLVCNAVPALLCTLLTLCVDPNGNTLKVRNDRKDSWISALSFFSFSHISHSLPHQVIDSSVATVLHKQWISMTQHASETITNVAQMYYVNMHHPQLVSQTIWDTNRS